MGGSLWDNLVLAMTEILVIYRGILELSRRKREILISTKAQELGPVTSQEEFLIRQLGKLEASRRDTLCDLADIYQLNKDQLTLENLRQLADPENAEKLASIASEFDLVIKELTPLNQVNSELIQQGLTFVKYSINLLTQTTVGPTYAPNGQGTSLMHSRKLFDQKA